MTTLMRQWQDTYGIAWHLVCLFCGWPGVRSPALDQPLTMRELIEHFSQRHGAVI